MIVADRQLRVVHAEGVGLTASGHAVAGWAGRLLFEVLPEGSLAELAPAYRAALEGAQQSYEYSSRVAADAFSVQITPVRDAGGVVTSVVSIFQDISERLGVVDALARSEARLHESEGLVGAGSWELIPETGVITYSEGFARSIGLSGRDTLDLPGFLTRVLDEDHEVVSAAIAECLKVGSAACEFRVLGVGDAVRIVKVQGQATRGLEGRPAYLHGALVDVTEAREAERDRLTAVSLFRQGFDAAPIGMGLTDPEGGRYVRVNDALCRLLGRTSKELLGESIVTVTHPDDQAVDRDARRAMLDGTLSSFVVDKRYLRLDGSAVWATLHVAPVRDADGSVRAFFSQVIDITDCKVREARVEQDVGDAGWLGRIRNAIDDDRLVLYRQPIVDLRTGETVQQELLLRMVGEDGSIIAPGEFLPIAERYGLIAEIDRWVLGQAVGLAAKGEPTEFNLSAASVGDPGILRELASAIQQTGANPALLVVEVTETAMIDQLDDGQRFAEGVAVLGCQLALDDFGTGFASLSYLKQIPAQKLKIDIEFVRDLIRSDTDERVVRGIVGMAREFDQTTIAEGIEDEATLVRLRELGVHLGQGYLFGRPAPLAEAASPGAPAARRAALHTPGHDPVSLVREAFAALAGRDLDAFLEICDPDVVLRPSHETSERTGRQAAYQGHDGIRAYFRDVAEVWEALKLTPTAFRPTLEAVIVFGHEEANAHGDVVRRDVLWMWRLCDELIVSVEVFPGAPQNDPGPARPLSVVRRPAPSGPPGGGRQVSSQTVAALATKFSETLRVGGSAEAERVMDEAILAGLAPTAIHALVIEPAMVQIGELWASGAISIADEHLATAISHRMLSRLLNALTVAPPRSRELVLLAAVEGQLHFLGLRMIADVLEGAGFDVQFLGGDVPLQSLRDFVAEHQPAVIGLTFGIATDVSQLAKAIGAIHEVSPAPRIMLGGRAVPPGLRNAGYPFVPSSLEVLDTVASLLDSPPQTLSPVVLTLLAKLARPASTAGSIASGPTTTDQDSLTSEDVDSADERRDEAAEVRDTVADGRDASAVRRELASAEASAVAQQRETAANERDTAADERDTVADDRGDAAERRDIAAAERDSAANDRERAADERDNAADNKDGVDRASEHRRDAQRRRETAAATRGAMALRREGANESQAFATQKRDAVTRHRAQLADERNHADSSREQQAAIGDRESSAKDRRNLSLDRRQAAEDRRQAARQHAQAGTDGLTATLRRERGMLTLQHALDQAGADGRLVLAFVDVDGLKAINDTQGHAAGDQLLRDTAEALRITLQPTDVIVRYGGDEFVCALPGVDMKTAGARFSEVAISLTQRSPNSSVSVGMAARKRHETLEQLTTRADAALYTGRHRKRGQLAPAA